MQIEQTLLRSNERLIRGRGRYKGAIELIHIRVGTTRVKNDPLRSGMYYDKMACGVTLFGDVLGGTPDARRATCTKCLGKYQPKRGQPPIPEVMRAGH